MLNNVKVTINQLGLLREIKSQLHKDPGLNKTLSRRIEKNFEKIKKDFINEFLGHNVTRQLANGDSMLFSFIGFWAGHDPISPLLKILDSQTFIKYRNFNTRGQARVTINMPDENELTQASPMPWAKGLSWVKGIEVGIPDLGKFLHKPDIPVSRSGGGIQSKNTISRSGFKSEPYLLVMLKKYRQIFSRAGFLVR